MESTTQIYNLSANYDSRKSFYGKAEVLIEGDKVMLRSYSTIVACIEGDKAEVYGWYSNTTGRHIKEFLLQNGFEAKNKNQIMEDYFKK